IFARDYLWKPEAFNQAPVFDDDTATQSVDEGATLEFSVAATDPDAPRDSVTYSAAGLPSGATLDPETGAVSWTPSYAQGGTYEVEFTASDGTKSWSLSSTRTVTITV